MAKFIPLEGPMTSLLTPITLTKLKQLLGEEIEITDCAQWSTHEVVIVRKASWGKSPINQTASSLAGLKSPIYGDAVLCSHDDIA